MSGVRFEVANHVATITIARPDVMNAIDLVTEAELQRIWSELEQRRDVRVIVLTGDGERAFCTGADMKTPSAAPPLKGVDYWAAARPGGFGGIALRETLNIPVIARVTKTPYLALLFDIDMGTLRDLYDVMADSLPSAARSRSLAVHTGDANLVTEMDRRADAFLTLPGGLGTLEELLEIWVARILRMHDKPVVVLDPDGVFAHLRAQIDQLVSAGFARPSVHDAIAWTSDVGEALDLVEKQPSLLPPTPDEVLEAEP